MMKRILYTILCAAAALLPASCSQELEGTLYRPNSDDGKEIHFSVKAMTKTFPQDDRSGIMELSIVRPGTKGDHTVGLAQMGTDENIFSFPESVTIHDGEYGATVPVLVDLGECMKGSSYTTCIYIVSRDQATGNYGAKNTQYSDAVDIEISLELEWQPYMVNDPETGEPVQQTATYTYDAYWHGTSTGLLVEKADCDEMFFRLLDWGTKNVKFMWQVKEDGSCIVPKQNTGVYNDTYGQYIYVSDYPHNIYGSTTYSYKNYPCTANEERNFFSFTLIYYREESTGNFGHAVETVSFDDRQAKVPSVDIEYLGVDSTATGFVGAKVAFKPQQGAKSVRAAFFPGQIDEDAIQAAGESLKTGDDVEDAIRTETIFAYDERSWSLPHGPITIVAVAFDENGESGNTQSLLFTFDPEGEYSVKVRTFRLYCDLYNETYDPTKSLFTEIHTENLAGGWYATMKLSDWKTATRSRTVSDYLKTRTPMDATYLSRANGKGRTGTYTSLASNTEYIFVALLVNKYGEEKFVSDTCFTAAASSDSGIDQFRSDVTLDSFTGSYLCTVGVGEKLSSTTDMTIRVDINRMDDNRVIISGLASPIADFNPVIVAYFDAVRHCLVLDSQNVGTYGGHYAQFSFYTGTSYVFSGCYLLGWIGDELVWLNAPDSKYNYVGYTFMEFSTENPSSATYLKSIVDTKVFVHPTMKVLEKNVNS